MWIFQYDWIWILQATLFQMFSVVRLRKSVSFPVIFIRYVFSIAHCFRKPMGFIVFKAGTFFCSFPLFHKHSTPKDIEYRPFLQEQITHAINYGGEHVLQLIISCLYCQYIGYFISRHLVPCLLGLCLPPTIVFIQYLSHHLQQNWKAIKQSFQLLVSTNPVTYNNHIISSCEEKKSL